MNYRTRRRGGTGFPTRDEDKPTGWNPRATHHHTSNPPANVSPAPTLQKMIRSPSVKIPSSAAHPSAIETLAALVLPYFEIVTTNLSYGMPTRLLTAFRIRSFAWCG